MKSIVLFDGECNFCNQSVQFIIKRDPVVHFNFAHLSSQTGHRLIKKLNIPKDSDSLILIQGNTYYTESTAALNISRKLNKGWPLLFGFIIIPKFLRDFIYRIVANNRYTLFGKAKSCKTLNPTDQQRFLL